MAKKPALLSDSLLNNRPRKGEARAQTEVEARGGEVEKAPQPSATPRRRKRRTQNTEQLNLRVSPETLERFIDLADSKGRKFGDMLAELLDVYANK